MVLMLPEEILENVVVLASEMKETVFYYSPQEWSCDDGSEVTAGKVVIPDNRNENSASSRTLLRLSKTSRVFRRLVLPFLYAEVIIQIPRVSLSKSAMRKAYQTMFSILKAFPHKDLIRKVYVQGRFFGPKSTANYAQILAQLDKVKDFEVQAELMDCDPVFLAALSTHQPLQRAKFWTLNGQDEEDEESWPDFEDAAIPTTFRSGLDIQVARICLYRETDVILVERWMNAGVGAETLLIYPTLSVIRGVISKWSALTYRGLKTLRIYGSAECLGNEIMFNGFLQNHPELKTIDIHVQGYGHSEFLLTRPLYESFQTTNMRTGDITFQRTSSSKFGYETVQLIYFTNDSTALAKAMERGASCLSSAQSIILAAVDLQGVSHHLNKEFSRRAFSRLHHLERLSLTRLLLPDSSHTMMPVPKSFPKCKCPSKLKCGNSRTAFHSLQLAYEIASAIPSLKYIGIGWVKDNEAETFDESDDDDMGPLCRMSVGCNVEREESGAVKRVVDKTLLSRPIWWPV